MKKRGGTVVAVCVDKPADSKKVVDRYKIAFDILSDSDLKLIRPLGLVFHEPMGRGDIALPANYLVDKTGKVVWRYLSSAVQDRVDPEQVMREVSKLPV